MTDKRRHFRNQNTATVTFRPPSGPAVTVLVHGRPTDVRHQIQTAMERNVKTIVFEDLNTDKKVRIKLDDYDVWSVK